MGFSLCPACWPRFSRLVPPSSRREKISQPPQNQHAAAYFRIDGGIPPRGAPSSKSTLADARDVRQKGENRADAIILAFPCQNLLQR
jgi:hypothetical protein